MAERPFAPACKQDTDKLWRDGYGSGHRAIAVRAPRAKSSDRDWPHNRHRQSERRSWNLLFIIFADRDVDGYRCLGHSRLDRMVSICPMRYEADVA